MRSSAIMSSDDELDLPKKVTMADMTNVLKDEMADLD